MRVILFLFLSLSSYAQKQKLFSKLKLEPDLKLICVTDRFDSLQKNKRFTFYCDNADAIDNVMSSFEIGGPAPQDAVANLINLYILKGKEVIRKQILFNTSYNSVITDLKGEYNAYYFDTSQLRRMNRLYPIEHKAVWVTFDSKSELDDYLRKHENNDSFLCFQDNTHELPGVGAVYVRKNSQLSNVSKCETLLEKEISKHTRKDDYSVGLLFDEGNVDEIKFEVECSKELFQKITNPSFRKGPWRQNKIQLLTYWKK